MFVKPDNIRPLWCSGVYSRVNLHMCANVSEERSFSALKICYPVTCPCNLTTQKATLKNLTVV